MKKKYIKILILAFLIVTCTTKKKYQVEEHLSPQQQDELLWKIIRYVGRPPEGLTIPERFYPQYDSFYREQKRLLSFDAYYLKGNVHYFLVSRSAPSLVEKRVATGGRFALNESSVMTEYEEVFRTWKMVPDTLRKRGIFLFDKLVRGEDLQRYYTQNSPSVEYIEFPDQRTYYEKSSRTWKTR